MEWGWGWGWANRAMHVWHMEHVGKWSMFGTWTCWEMEQCFCKNKKLSGLCFLIFNYNLYFLS